MRGLLALAIMSAAVPSTAPAQTDPNMSCVERLRMPLYPRLAEAARISGSVMAVVTLTSEGSIQKTDFEFGDATATARRLFSPAIEQALRLSAFKKNCGSKLVQLVFHFELGQNPDPNNLPQSVAFGYPNQFWISVPPRVLQP
jgi:hypothetical protein